MEEKDKPIKEEIPDIFDKQSKFPVEALLGKPKNVFSRYKEIALLAIITPLLQIFPKDTLISLFVFLGYLMINKGLQNLLNTKFNFPKINNLINFKIIFLFILLISESELLKSFIGGNNEQLSFINIGFKIILYMIITAIAMNLNHDFKDFSLLFNKYRKSLIMVGIFGILLQILDIADKVILKSYHGNLGQLQFWETIIFIILIFFVLVNVYNSIYLSRIFFKASKETN